MAQTIEKSRFDEIEENCSGNHYEGDEVCSELHGFIAAGGGQQFSVAEDIYRHVYSPGGVAGPARPVYEVVLKPEVDEVVPEPILRVATYRELDITAIETRERDGIEQTAILLEPADTEMHPR